MAGGYGVPQTIFLLMLSISSLFELSAAETTLAMIKPDAVRANHVDAIRTIIKSSGFVIARERRVTLDLETAEEFYAEHRGKSFFTDLINFMTSGPVVAMELVDDNAVSKWRFLIGPTDPERAKQEKPDSIRAKFGSSTTQNCVHGSDSPLTAEREIDILFSRGHEEDAVKNLSDSKVLIEHDEL